MSDVNFLPDPCPLPDAQKKRALNEKERLLYAPMAGVGGLVYDKDAVYIDVPASHVTQLQVRPVSSKLFFMTILDSTHCVRPGLLQEEVRPTTELVQSLIDTHATLDTKMAASKVSLFSGSATLEPADASEQTGLVHPGFY